MTLKLLVADDSVTIQKIVSLAFSGDDVVIKAASDGNSALDLIRTSKPDVVLADVFMPGCSGYEVCARIKEDSELKHIPVILLVGTFEPFDESEASRVRCDGCLTKPFDTSELIQTVHALVDNEVPPKAEPPAELAAENVQNEPDAAKSVRVSLPNGRGCVTQAARESFLGEARILEIFDKDVPSEQAVPRTVEKPAPKEQISEQSLDLIVEKVVRKMSPELIREVAWEVVPELSEAIIRSTIKERQ